MGSGRERPRPFGDGEGAAVLLVDDEILVRDVIQAALEEGGYLVAAASDGQAALSALEEHGGDYRALVIDIDLGVGLRGWELARRARELHPEVAIIYVTGGAQHEYASQRVPNSVLVGKPFGVAQIIDAVSGLIGA